MLSAYFKTIFLSGAAFAGTLGKPAPVLERAACNADNCLRVYTNTPAVASAFCSTYLEATATVLVTQTVTISSTNTISPSPTSFPTIPAQVTPSHLSSQCNLQTNSLATVLTSRLTSACNCISIVPTTVTTTLLAPAKTITIPTPTTSPFYLKAQGSGEMQDDTYFLFDDCSGATGHPFIYAGYPSPQSIFVLGSDGYLHGGSCFNVVAGSFGGDSDLLFFLDPTRPGTEGFTPATCGATGGNLACTGANGRSVFFFSNGVYGSGVLAFGAVNGGSAVTVQMVDA